MKRISIATLAVLGIAACSSSSGNDGGTDSGITNVCAVAPITVPASKFGTCDATLIGVVNGELVVFAVVDAGACELTKTSGNCTAAQQAALLPTFACVDYTAQNLPVCVDGGEGEWVSAQHGAELECAIDAGSGVQCAEAIFFSQSVPDAG